MGYVYWSITQLVMSLTSSKTRYTFACQCFWLNFEVPILKCVCWFVGLLSKLNYLIPKNKFTILEVFYGAQDLEGKVHKIYSYHLFWSMLALHTWKMDIWNYFLSLHFYVNHILDSDSYLLKDGCLFMLRKKCIQCLQ
jgi:hypothetical protein